MSTKNIDARIQHKHDTEANWDANKTFIPYAGELIIFDVDDEHSIQRQKIGDGVNLLSSLPFVDANAILVSGGGQVQLVGDFGEPPYVIQIDQDDAILADTISATNIAISNPNYVSNNLDAILSEINSKISGKMPAVAGQQGQVLTFDAQGRLTAAAISSGIPTGGTTGQILAKKTNADGDVQWITISIPTGDFVPVTREINGYQLSDNITLVADDIGAVDAELGGRIKGDIRLQGASTYGLKLLFGNNNYTYLHNDALNHLVVNAKRGIDISADSNATVMLNGSQIATMDDLENISFNDDGTYVPTTRKINNKALSADITLTADDVQARPSTWMPTAADVGAVANTVTVNGKALTSSITLAITDITDGASKSYVNSAIQSAVLSSWAGSY